MSESPLDSRGFLLSASLLRDKVASFESYPFNLPAVRPLETLPLHRSVTFIVGENGSGKSTLLEGLAVALGFNAEGGSRNFNFATRASHSELGRHLRIARSHRRPRTSFFLRAESFYNVATEIERLSQDGPSLLDAYGGTSLHEQSHGESFLALVLNRFGPEGLYLLDEPEAALSPARQLTLLARMHQLVQQGSQFIIATHSPILMAYPDAIILGLGENGLSPVRYEDTEHYLLTRQFLNNPQGIMRQLFE
ncbi:MAG TPA: AAA family ATPase [Rariglobus sp.]|nr:AAA family ATPase [Rariglobus sp.]